MSEVNCFSGNILIVDDKESDLRILERMLRDNGYTRIIATQDPGQVVELHRKHDFDLILLDLHLPAMEGFELMNTLGKEIADPYLSIVVMIENPDYRLRVLEAGARDFICKPFDPIDVRSRLRNTLEVRLLHREREKYIAKLEQRVDERTAELRESEARFRGFTELASDWYWEQDKFGNFTKVSGPVPEILGIAVDSPQASNEEMTSGWDNEERNLLQAMITSRESFLDYKFIHRGSDGIRQKFLISGQPMFDSHCTFLGYRGIGVEIATKKKDVMRANQTVAQPGA